MWVYSAVWGRGAAERERLESVGDGHLHSATRDKFALFRILCMWNYMAYTLLCLASFIPHDDFEIYPCYVYQ